MTNSQGIAAPVHLIAQGPQPSTIVRATLRTARPSNNLCALMKPPTVEEAKRLKAKLKFNISRSAMFHLPRSSTCSLIMEHAATGLWAQLT